MFLLEVAESEAFRWLRREMGDTDLILAPPPEAGERALLYAGRIDSRAELARVWRYHNSGRVVGTCWFAGHPQTLAIGQARADFCCGRKFIAYCST